MKRKQISVDIFTGCSCSCRYCFVHLHPIRGRSMTPENFKALVNIFDKEEYNFVYLYNSGEPFLHPNVYEFIQQLRARKIRVNVATKFSCKMDWDRFAVAPPHELLITLDSLKEEVAKRVAPGLDLSLVKENLKCLSKWFKALDQSVRPLLVFNLTVNSLNYSEIEDIHTYVHDLFVLHNLPVNFGGKGMGLGFGCSTEEEVREAVKEGGFLWTDKFHEVRFRIEGGMIVPLYDERCWPNGRVCDMIPVIGWDGSLLPCCHDFFHKSSMGNVFERGSIDQILQSPEGLATLERGRKLELPICRWCN